MANHPQNQPSSEQRWWLLVETQAEGPHSRAYLVACLRGGRIGVESLACPEGAQEWRPIAAWPQLAANLSSIAPTSYIGPPALPSGMPSREATQVGVLTNPRLPPMANWICSYCIAVSPILWIAQNLSCCVTGLTFHENSEFLWLGILLDAVSAAISLGVTIALAIGGLRLRNQEPSGTRLIITAIWVSLVAGAVNLVAWIILVGVATFSETDQFAEQNTAAEIIGYGLYVVGISELAFTIVALVWLRRHKDKLSLVS